MEVNAGEYGFAVEIVEGHILVPEIARSQFPKSDHAEAELHGIAEKVA